MITRKMTALSSLERQMKTCFVCLAEKPESEFYSHKRMADGLLGKCKACTSAYEKQRRRDPKYRDRILSYDRGRGARQSVEYLRDFRNKNPQAYKAQTAVSNAVRDGRLFKPSCCESCGVSGKLHGHHHDYSKPLAVVWLCVACHRQHHAMMDLIERAMAASEKSA